VNVASRLKGDIVDRRRPHAKVRELAVSTASDANPSRRWKIDRRVETV